MPDNERTESDRRPPVTAVARPRKTPDRRSEEETLIAATDTMTVYTVDLQGHGTWVQSCTFPQSGVNRHSTVLANICEVQQPSGEPLDFPYIGAANMRINNIAPHDDEVVDLRIEVDWPKELHIRIHFVVWP